MNLITLRELIMQTYRSNDSPVNFSVSNRKFCEGFCISPKYGAVLMIHVFLKLSSGSLEILQNRQIGVKKLKLM